MKIEEYRKFTGVTKKSMGGQIEDSIHCVLGIISELTNELVEAYLKEDEVNVMEELGDANWYLSEYANVWNLDTSFIDRDYTQEQLQSIVFELGQNLGKLADIDKAAWIYGKEIDLQVRQELLEAVWLAAEVMANDFDGGDAIRKRNLQKLNTRYGDKFSEYLALNRDLEKEYEALTS